MVEALRVTSGLILPVPCVPVETPAVLSILSEKSEYTSFDPFAEEVLSFIEKVDHGDSNLYLTQRNRGRSVFAT